MAHDPFIPKGTIPMVGALVAFAVIVVTVATLMPGGRPAVAVAAETVAITVADAPDGGIVVAAEAGETRLAPGSAGFIRGVLRALAFEREKHGIGPRDAFVLGRDARGTLFITDPAIGTRIDLRAFGRDNEAAFAALFAQSRTAQTQDKAAIRETRDARSL